MDEAVLEDHRLRLSLVSRLFACQRRHLTRPLAAEGLVFISWDVERQQARRGGVVKGSDRTGGATTRPRLGAGTGSQHDAPWAWPSLVGRYCAQGMCTARTGGS